MRQYDVKGKQVHDANIVATMKTYRVYRLATLNPVDFRRYRRELTLVSLTA